MSLKLITQGGLRLLSGAHEMWLDARRPKPFSFISHAHSDHVARHQRILCSELTAALLRKRFSIPAESIFSLPFHEAHSENDFTVELLPAGHIAGSAMIHVTCHISGESFLYTGDYKLRPSRAAESCVLKPADTLIMESTFGLAKYVFPPAAEIERDAVEFVENALADGVSPFLLGYSLGKAQEICSILAAYNKQHVVHRTVREMTEVCRTAVMALPEPVEWDYDDHSAKIIVAPPQLNGPKILARIGAVRSAVFTGWALDASAIYRYKTQRAIALSDHASFPELLETARLVSPKKIITVHGYTRELAATLRALGFEAWSAYGNDQLELSLGD